MRLILEKCVISCIFNDKSVFLMYNKVLKIIIYIEVDAYDNDKKYI